MIDYLRRCVKAVGRYDDGYFSSAYAAVLNAVDKGKKISLKLLLEFIQVLRVVFRRLRACVLIAQGSLAGKAEHHEKHEDNKKYLHRERKMYGRLERSFHLEDIDEETMEAEFKDGILTISVSKVDEDKNKRYIEVK